MLGIGKIQTCSRSYRARAGGSNLLLVSHKAFQSKSSNMFYQFLIRSYFFPLSSGEKFQTSNNMENQLWKANIGVGPTHAGNQVGELTPGERPSLFASGKRTPSVCDRALTKITTHLSVHSEKTKWGKAMHSIEIIVKMRGRVTLQTQKQQDKNILGLTK